MIEDILEPLEVAFISVSEKFDTSTAQGMLFLQMVGSFGEFERKIINERTKGGRLATAKDNKYAGGQVPYGYIVVNGQPVIDEVRAAIVKRVFAEYHDGYNFNKIASRLNNEGITTKSGKKWTAQHVKNMIHTKTYTGVSKYDGLKEKNAIQQKDVFPKIVSKQLWNKIHSM